ncbi:MAG: hypothetical protein HQK83_08340 [Fibrobacteria bacterium]|nr:hypothetical protein [Fibrobacteria bacterium]
MYQHIIDFPKFTLPEKKSDNGVLPNLVKHLLLKLNALTGKQIGDVSDEVMAFLQSDKQFRNLRRLEYILEYAYAVCSGAIIEQYHLPEEMEEVQGFFVHDVELKKMSQKRDSEMKIISEVLKETKFNKSKAAQELGMSRSTLWRKMKRYQLI